MAVTQYDEVLLRNDPEGLARLGEITQQWLEYDKEGGHTKEEYQALRDEGEAIRNRNYYYTSDEGYYAGDLEKPQETKKEETKQQTTTPTYDYTPTYQTQNYYTPPTVDEYKQQYEDNSWLEAAQEANQAAVQKGVDEILADLEDALPQYDQAKEEAYLQGLKNKSNSRLASQIAGDKGGIGQKQYDATTAEVDNELLQIALSKMQLQNDAQQQITALENEGRLQDAELVKEWYQNKLSDLLSYEQWLANYSQDQTQLDYSIYSTDRDYAYNRAVSMLEKGMITADALTALGISEADAQNYANYYNQLAQYNLDEAKLELKQLNASIAAASTTTTEEGYALVHHADGTTDIVKTLNGEMVGYDGQEGDWIDSGNEQEPKLFFNSGTGEFNLTESRYTTDTDKANAYSANVSQYETLTSTKYKDPSTAVKTLQVYMDELTPQVEQLKSQRAVLVKEQRPYITGGDVNSANVYTNKIAEIDKQINAIDSQRISIDDMITYFSSL